MENGTLKNEKINLQFWNNENNKDFRIISDNSYPQNKYIIWNCEL